MRALLVLCCLLVAACAARPAPPGHIRILETSQVRHVALENGTTVPIRLGRMVFADGVEGLLVDYVTQHPLGSAAVAAEIPFVWWAALPSARQVSYTQGWVRALENMSGGANHGEAYRACLTAEGKTLWLQLDGGLRKEDRDAGRKCLPAVQAREGVPSED